MKTSNFLSLNTRDFLKALLMATILPPLLLIQQSLEAGQLTFDWKHLGMVSVAAFVGYLIKNLFTPASIVSKIQADADKK